MISVERSKQEVQDAKYRFEYAYFLQENKQILNAVSLYQKSLKIRKKFFQEKSQEYLPDIAMTHNNLGALFRELGEFKQAEQEYLKAIDQYKELLDINPQMYIEFAIDALGNLANLLGDNNEFEKAIIYFEEIISMRTELANSEFDKFGASLSKSLNNFGILLNEKKRF